MTGREFFTRFPALYPFLLIQLQDAAATVDRTTAASQLHHALCLVFNPRCGRSAVYRTREMAARALVPFVLVTQIPATVQTLLRELPPEPRPQAQQNHIHGTLLQVLFLLRSYQAESHRPPQTGSGISGALRQHMWLASRQNRCVVTRGAYLDVLQCLCGPLACILP
ncbi:hypothetical protein CRUP_007009, partial [Coryphaenoides rupestris]